MKEAKISLAEDNICHPCTMEKEGLFRTYSEKHFGPSACYTNEVSNHIPIGNIILLICTFGLAYDEDFFNERLFEGTIAFDTLTKEVCSLIKSKLEKEGITFNAFICKFLGEPEEYENIPDEVNFKIKADRKIYEPKKGDVRIGTIDVSYSVFF